MFIKSCLTTRTQERNWKDSDEIRAWTTHREQTERVIETDAQEKKHTAITFMIKYSVQFNSSLDGPIRENRARGGVLTDV